MSEQLTPEERELRNIYAGIAVSGLLVRMTRDATLTYDTIADKAFTLADAMIIRSRK